MTEPRGPGIGQGVTLPRRRRPVLAEVLDARQDTADQGPHPLGRAIDASIRCCFGGGIRGGGGSGGAAGEMATPWRSGPPTSETITWTGDTGLASAAHWLSAEHAYFFSVPPEIPCGLSHPAIIYAVVLGDRLIRGRRCTMMRRIPIDRIASVERGDYGGRLVAQADLGCCAS